MSDRDELPGGESGAPESVVVPQKFTRRSTQTVTLDDVATHARVSPQTVSRSIRNPQLVSKSTLERVRGSIVATGYVPNLTASHLASNRSMTVAAILPTISASIFADALDGLDEALSPHGYHLFIGSTNYSSQREEELIRTLLGRRPDGIFIVGTAHSEATTAMLKAARVPVVETWNLTESPIHSVVGFSNREAIRSLVHYVVSKGYRHPTFAGSMQAGDTRAVERSRGFEGAVRGLLPNEPVRIVDSGDRSIDLDTGILLLDRVLNDHPETDVVMFSSDVFAAGALLECVRRGIAVPGRLAITGFGDFDIARHVFPSLTTVAVPSREIGTRAGELLLKSMPDPDAAAEEINLGFSVVARDSA
jgi:LacI family gluconate utilization system Gnt-I transcriptional repressor